MEFKAWPWKKKSSEKTSSLSGSDQEVENIRNQSQPSHIAKEAINLGNSSFQSPAVVESETRKNKVDVGVTEGKLDSWGYELEGLKQKVAILSDENYGLNQHLRREKVKVEENQLGVFMNRLDSKKLHKISTCVLEKDVEYEEMNMGKGNAPPHPDQPSTSNMLLNNVGLDLMDDFLDMEDQIKGKNITSSITHIMELENTVSALQFEVVKLNSQNKHLEDQIEKQRMMNEDLHGQLTEFSQKNNYLEIALEDKNNFCEELEATCLELQLQLESVISTQMSKSKVEEWQKKFIMKSPATMEATTKLAECQRTIFNIEKKLKGLSSTGETELFDRLMTFSVTTNHPTVIKQNKSLRQQLASDDCIKLTHRRRQKHQNKTEISEIEPQPSSVIAPTTIVEPLQPKQPTLRATSPIEGPHYMHVSTVKIDGDDGRTRTGPRNNK